MLVSSAKRQNLNLFEHFWISVTYSKKSNGPRIDPWGTPHPTTALSEIQWPTCVVCVRFLRYEEIQSLTNPWKPLIMIEFIKQNVVIDDVEAFLRSTNHIPQDNNRWFMFACISLTMTNIACWVECPSRKPYCEEYKSSCFFM